MTAWKNDWRGPGLQLWRRDEGDLARSDPAVQVPIKRKRQKRKDRTNYPSFWSRKEGKELRGREEEVAWIRKNMHSPLRLM